MEGQSILKPTRRSAMAMVLGGAATAIVARGFLHKALADDVVDVSKLKPGDYVWQPNLSSTGSVAIIVSLPVQLCFVYRNGIRIAVSTVSTGKPGYETPTGVFTILQKAKVHHSSTYNEASMPNTERLTWGGVALHAGGLPGYPSSHGCIHLPLKFSAELFTITQIGTPVIIAGAHADPTAIVHPGMVLGQYAEHEFEQAVSAEKNPPVGDNVPHTSIIVSSAGNAIDVLSNGEIVASGKATIDNPGQPLGENVFILQGTNGDAKGLTWHAIAFTQDTAMPASDSDPAAVIKRIHGDTPVIEAIKQRMVAGTVLITTDLPLTPDARSGKDFVVMSSDTV
jgi:hypothetical protein